MQLKDILKEKGSKVWSAHPEQTIQEALDLLVDKKIGALLVFDKKNKIVGMLSERDIMRVCQKDSRNLAGKIVSDVMTKEIIICTPEDSIAYVMGIMTQNRIRHIPVLSEGKLQGMISIGDVVKAQLKESEYQIKYLKEYMFGG